MNHREFLQALSPQQRKQLTEKSDAKGVVRLAQHWALILLLATLIISKVPGWPLLMLPLGIVLVFQFTLLHETIHFTVFRSRWINVAVAKICAYILFLPPAWFRYFHLEHHRHTHVIGKDPELAATKPDTRSQYWLYISGLPLWWGSLKTLWVNASGNYADVYVPNDGRRQVQQEAIAMLGVYAVVLVGVLTFGLHQVFYVWLLPIILGQPFLRIYLLAEHTGCPHDSNMFRNTRTTYTNAAMCWLAWNMPYHSEHHSYVSVPFHRLPDLHKMAKAHLQMTEQSYVVFHRKLFSRLANK